MIETIKICSVDYQVIEKPSIEMPDLLGLCHSSIQQIWLCESNTEETNKNTLLHEALHTISHSYDLELSERQVSVTATAIIALFRDNPELIDYILKP
jgi:hypothetical protein